MSDRDAEALLEGVTPEGREDLAEVAAFFGDLKRSFPEPDVEHLENAHLAAMAEAARLLTVKGEPAVRPASKAFGPAEQASGLPEQRRSEMLKNVLTKRWVQLLAASMALILAFGGAAYAGVLPAPVQKAVASAAEQVGVSLPDPDDAVEAETPTAASKEDTVAPEAADVQHDEDESATAPVTSVEEKDSDEQDATSVEEKDDADEQKATSVEEKDDAEQAPAIEEQESDADEHGSVQQPQGSSSGSTAAEESESSSGESD